jgi:hypothetical protein
MADSRGRPPKNLDTDMAHCHYLPNKSQVTYIGIEFLQPHKMYNTADSISNNKSIRFITIPLEITTEFRRKCSTCYIYSFALLILL